MPSLRAAFSLVPEYLRTLDHAGPVVDFNEYQPQLGRRMRALKLWWILRYFGVRVDETLEEYVAEARRHPLFELFPRTSAGHPGRDSLGD